MNKEEILKELRKQFDLTKKRLNFKSSFEEINKLFYLEDMALSMGFVSNNFSRQMINWITEGIYQWISELYAWIYPSPMDFMRLSESKILSNDEKKEISLLIDKIMYLGRKTKRIAFEGLIKKEEADFIDEIIDFHRNYFCPVMLKYHKKFEKFWREEFENST